MNGSEIPTHRAKPKPQQQPQTKSTQKYVGRGVFPAFIYIYVKLATTYYDEIGYCLFPS